MTPLSTEQVDQFVEEGFAKIEQAFSTALADECRALLWEATGCKADPGSWEQPVIRIGELSHPTLIKAANTDTLHHAFDQLLGKGNWYRKTSLGSFPIRFPVKAPATDTGWHVDASFPGDDFNNYLEWRINIRSKGRGLLMLFLFSDVAEADAPTAIRLGSHLDVARLLATHGEQGLSFMQLAQQLDGLPKRRELLATGKAGTVYLSHPFIVHAARDHHGISPKFMAQPPLFTRQDFDLLKPLQELYPVESAIVKAMHFVQGNHNS